MLVRLAERHALADERLGRVGRAQQRIGDRGGQPLAVELEPADHHRERAAARRGRRLRAANTGGLSSCRSRS